MCSDPKLVILGTDTPFARCFLDACAENAFPAENIKAASKTREITYGDSSLRGYNKADITFKENALVVNFETEADNTALLHKAHKAGARVFDTSDAFLGHDGTGLAFIAEHQKLNIVPLGLSTALARVLLPLSDKMIDRIVISTYQSVSGSGQAAQDELYNQTKAIFMNMPVQPQQFSKQIAFNALPHVGRFMDGDHTQTEWRMKVELKKLLGAKIKVAVQAVHIPVFTGDAASVFVSFKDEIDLDEVVTTLSQQSDLTVIPLDSTAEYVTPEEMQGEYSLFISRLREDTSVENGLVFWLSLDTYRFAALQLYTILFSKNIGSNSG